MTSMADDQAGPGEKGAPQGNRHANKPGRFTPKKDPVPVSAAPRSAVGVGAAAPGSATSSGRYTPPAAREAVKLDGGTGRWVLPVLFALLVLGGLLIVLNYMSVLLPGAPSNWWLLGGMGCLVASLVVATQLK
jgi:hypothetical protein